MATGITRIRSSLLRVAAAAPRRCHQALSVAPTVRTVGSRGWTGRRAFSSPSAAVDALASLERSIAARETHAALAHFDALPAPPSQLLSQKLALLLAKRGWRDDVVRAVEILRGVYQNPQLRPDDYTYAASVFVVDACLRHNLLDAALEIHEEAFNVGVVLDLRAYESLVRALVDTDQPDDAVQLLEDISSSNDIAPTEHMYLPLLVALVSRQDYQSATSMLELGRTRGVTFTSETFNPLLDFVGEDKDASDSLVSFLSYIEDIWEDAKLINELVAVVADDDDEDDDDLDESPPGDVDGDK